jgi:tRNA(fMet)-specific endonuclease VapC
MYILDTDHISLIQRNGVEGQRIVSKLLDANIAELTVTIITYEEQVRGRLSVLSKAKKLEAKLLAYQGLQQLTTDYRVIIVLPFDRAAAMHHQTLRSDYPRLGTMDLKIAAICLANRATLLTRNTSDFAQIQALNVEDWSCADT